MVSDIPLQSIVTWVDPSERINPETAENVTESEASFVAVKVICTFEPDWTLWPLPKPKVIVPNEKVINDKEIKSIKPIHIDLGLDERRTDER